MEEPRDNWEKGQTLWGEREGRDTGADGSASSETENNNQEHEKRYIQGYKLPDTA